MKVTITGLKVNYLHSTCPRAACRIKHVTVRFQHKKCKQLKGKNIKLQI